MINAFGVEHVSKRLVLKPLLKKPDLVSKTEPKTVSDSLSPVLPSTTVLAYNNSRANKKKAATRNLAAKLGGTAAGFGAGYLGYRYGKGKIGYLKRGSDLKIPGRKKPIKVSSEKKQGYAASTATSMGAGIGGYIGGKTSLDRIKRDPQYRYG